MSRLLLLAFLCFALAVSQVWADPKLHVLVRGDSHFAPFEYLDENNQAKGFDIDILKAVAEVTDLSIELRLGPWEEVRSDLEQGRIDALVGMRYSEERDLQLDFSAPYLINSSAVFIRNDSEIRSLDDLKGKEIIVQRGDIMDDYVRSSMLSSNIIFVADQIKALELLASGKHDAALCSRLRGLYLVQQLGLDNIKTLGSELAGAPYGFAVAEGNSLLLARLNEGLRILKATGRYDEIYRSWFGLYEKTNFSRKLIRYAFWTLTPVLLLLTAAVAWSWALKRQVQIKTRELGEQLAERQRAEAKLESEKKFRQFVEVSPVPMAIVGKGQSILYVNNKFTEMFGYTLEDLPDMPTWWSMACPDMKQTPALLKKWQDRFSSIGSRRSFGEPPEVDILCKDGTLRHVSCRQASIDERYFIVFNDITERKQAENALEYRSRVEALISAISTRFVNLASAEADQEINRALGEIGERIGVDRSYVFQFSADGNTLSNTHEWTAPGIEPHISRLQDRPRENFSWFLKQLEAGRGFFCPSVRQLGPEAQQEQKEWLLEGIQSLITVPMLLKGKMVGFIGFDSVLQERNWSEDILFLLRMVGESFANALERRRVESELRSAHRQMQDIIDFLPDATFVVDGQGKVVAWNLAVEQMTGVPKDEMLGKGNYAYSVPFYGEPRPTLVDLIGSNGHEQPSDYLHMDKESRSLFAEQYLPCVYGGKGAFVWAKASPLFDRDGNLVGAIESIRDISDRKEAQEKLEASLREMEAFVYTVSHDLRSPLAPIIGYADFLRDAYGDRLDSQALQCLNEINSCAHKMLSLMEDLLALAKVGQLDAPEEPVDVNEVVHQVLDNLATQIARSGVDVCVEPLPALRVPRTFLFQIFSNLIGNAVVYGGKDGSPIEIWGERNDDRVRFYVRDHGPGIAAKERERIFEVFYRGASGRNVAGTGIGLATVRKIAHLCGGKARAEEAPGGGTTFWVEMKEP